MEEKRRLEEERLRQEQEEIQRLQKEKKIIGICLLVGGLLATAIGYGYGMENGSIGLTAISGLGFIAFIVGLVILVRYNKVNINKRKK